MELLNKVAIEQLQRLCEWLDSLPYKSASLSDISSNHPDLVYWLDPKWSLKRKYVNVIFYSIGWGWRLRKDWRKRIDELMAEFDCLLKPQDFVRHKTFPSLFGQVKSFQIRVPDSPFSRDPSSLEVTVVLEGDGVQTSHSIENWEVVSEP